MALTLLSKMRRWVASPDLAIDMGTANTRLYALGYGLIADEPSVVKIEPETGVIEAVGSRAARLAGRDPNARSISPVHAGAIADIEAASSLLRPLVKRAQRYGLMKPRALACAPTDACEEEREALVETAIRAGASAVVVVPEPLAAAIGAGLDVSSPYAQMLVGIGDGVTDIAVIRSGTLISTCAVRTACSDLHHAISQTIAFKYGVLLFPKEAERLTHLVGALNHYDNEELYVTYGIDLLSGGPVSLCVSNLDIIESVEPELNTIIDAIHGMVRDLPPKTSCEVIENGICLTGGGANLRYLPERLSNATSLNVFPARDPMRAVIKGARMMLKVGAETNLWNN